MDAGSFLPFRVSTVDKGRSCQHGPPWNTDQNVFWSDGINGANGVRYGKPNDRKPDRWISMAINPAIIPKSPKVAANIIKPKRSSLAELAMLTEGATKLAMAVNATMITMAADTKPACTAPDPEPTRLRWRSRSPSLLAYEHRLP